MPVPDKLAPDGGKYPSVWKLMEGFDTDETAWKLLWEKDRSRQSDDPYGINGGFPIWAMKQFGTAQFYHDVRNNFIYILPTLIAKQSMTIMGKEINRNFCSLTDAIYLCSYAKSNIMNTEVYDRMDMMGNNETHTWVRFGPEYHGNITYQLLLAERYWWLKEKCLYGQDNEFNIFRVLCFVPPGCKWQAKGLAIGILSVIIQIILTSGIIFEVYRGWDIDEMFDNDSMIITMSFVVFSFISFIFISTVSKYYQFYNNMAWIIKLSPILRFLDFISNIIIGLIICCVALAYLLQSETVGDVVLNSFALTFIIELDDMANIFDSDEPELIKSDFAHLEIIMDFTAWDSTSWCYGENRRKVEMSWKNIFRAIGYCLGSPFAILYAIYYVLKEVIDRFINSDQIEPAFEKYKTELIEHYLGRHPDDPQYRKQEQEQAPNEEDPKEYEE